ncbi:unnamed protein product [Chrysoparadoxa australica]
MVSWTKYIGLQLVSASKGLLTQVQGAAYSQRLAGMIAFAASVGDGPNGPHAHFLKHSIDAVTLTAEPLSSAGSSARKGAPSNARKGYAPDQVASAIVGALRAVSNLDEDLHHSSFYYIMQGPKSFVDINEYAYSFMLLASPLLIGNLKAAYTLRHFRAAYAVAAVVAAMGYGAAAMACEHRWRSSVGPGSVLLLQSLWLAGYAVAALVARLAARAASEDRVERWQSLKAGMLGLALYSSSSLAMVNWPLAVAYVLLCAIPFAAVAPLDGSSQVTESSSLGARVRAWLVAVWLTCVSPAALAWVLGEATLLRWGRTWEDLEQHNFAVLCVVYYPVHLLALTVLFS